MKSIKFVLMVVLFISGICIGILANRLFPCNSCRKNNVSELAAYIQIDTTQAKKLFQDYYKGATAEKTPFKGFLLLKEQLNVLNQLLNQNKNLSGFRIYMAADSGKYERRILVGVNEINNEYIDDTKLIYRTTLGKADPCPPICDKTSPITR
jgi:hypothetical protein